MYYLLYDNVSSLLPSAYLLYVLALNDFIETALFRARNPHWRESVFLGTAEVEVNIWAIHRERKHFLQEIYKKFGPANNPIKWCIF